jgi:glycosyltransferase involved in cell wall biosynthesis
MKIVKKILIDGRTLNDSSTGVKVYTRALIKSYVDFYGKINVYVLVRKKLDELDIIQIVYDKKAYSFINFFIFHKFLRTIDFDILHSTGHYNSFFKVENKYYITTIYDLFFLTVPRFYRKSILLNFCGKIKSYFLTKYSLKNSDFITTISQTTKKDILRFYNYSSHVYYCGSNRITRNSEDGDILTNNNLCKNEYFLYVGFLSRHKNVDFLIKAFIQADTNKKLIICGKNTEQKTDIKNNIFGLGFVKDNDLAVLYENCAAFVFPSLYEGFGIPVIEVLQYGVKVFSSNGGALSEFSGRFVKFFDPKDENTLIPLLRKVDQIEQNKEEAIIYAKKYNWNTILLSMHNDIQIDLFKRDITNENIY